MKLQQLRSAIRKLRHDTHVVVCLNPGPGAVATEIIGAMETILDVTEDGKTEQKTVLVLVGKQ